ncbi:uncharacterized protein JCM6883_003690 [Sporobolomyces salmoneus]|uniref:uncharacterized protein n=1 Tax=Sporobolomyces salmoneus TaxID=183962 RepID=UPI00316F08E8
MLDQIAGRPSPSWRRSQVFLVLLFWISRIAFTSQRGPRFLYLRRLNAKLSRFTPWQIILSTLTVLYALRHGDVLLGLQAPEPLARLYSRDYYRATWIVTALDAGFATAGQIKWKWLRDIFSLLCTGYYLLFANEADEKLRKYRAICTVEMLRTTWEKTSNPYIKFFTRKDRPKLEITKKLFLPRPSGSKYTKPLTAYLFYSGDETSLAKESDLIFDIPGGGFICMDPEHHAERLLRWAKQTGRPVLSFDYGKAPEYPYPFAIDEMYDAYSLLHSTKGKCIGMNLNGKRDLRVVLTGDSAGANIGTAMLVKLLETRGGPSSSSSPPAPPLPVALIYAYAALSFHFTSWMPASDLQVLRSESHPDVQTLLKQKSHLEHRSPLSVVQDLEPRIEGSERKRPVVQRRKRNRTGSWGRGLVSNLPGSKSFASMRQHLGNGNGSVSAGEEDDSNELEQVTVTDEREKSVNERILWWNYGEGQEELEKQVEKDVGSKMNGTDKKEAVLENTRLAMTSRTAFFNDRIISPSMCRAMALLYIGPLNSPDLHSDYHISPIFTPPHLLHQFPPVYLSCGERDPFVDDTVIFAGKLREAKESRKMELLGKELRHGERLRMSGSPASRDPILDENEEDWVQSSIIEGWSHGYLQMVALLPAAEKVIQMMGNWIEDAFEKDTIKREKYGLGVHSSSTDSTSTIVPLPQTEVTPPTTEAVTSSPSSSVPPVANGKSLHPSDSAVVDSDEEEVLSFTPRNRRGSSNVSRTASPAPGYPGVRVASNPTSPTRNGFFPTQAQASSEQTSSIHTHLVTPVERALLDKYHSTSASKHSPSSPSLELRPTSTVPLPSSSTAATPLTRALSDEERSYRPSSAPPIEDVVKKARSGSAGSLPAPTGAQFVDAKHLLRRRRDDLVSGLSAGSSRMPSRDGSDDEGTR